MIGTRKIKECRAIAIHEKRDNLGGQQFFASNEEACELLEGDQDVEMKAVEIKAEEEAKKPFEGGRSKMLAFLNRD
jgi:hypothetical protein